MSYLAFVLRGVMRYEISSESIEALEEHLNQLPETDLVEKVMKEIPFSVSRKITIEKQQDRDTLTDSLPLEDESDTELLETNDEEEWVSRLAEHTSG